VTDPLAQDYAAWRGMLLRWTVLIVLAGAFLGYKVDFVVGDESNDIPHFGVFVVLILVLGLIVTAITGFLLLVYAAWKWHRVRVSRRLVAAAWVIQFLGPLLIFLIPVPHLLGLHGLEAVQFTALWIKTILMFYIPGLFALFPAVVRASLVVKQFLPESEVPGGLAVLASLFSALVYLVTLSVLVQISLNGYLVLGMVLLTASSLVYLVRVRALFKRHSPAEGRRIVRSVQWTSLTLTVAGSALLVQFALESPNLLWFVERVDVWMVLTFIVSTMSNRMLLTVVFADFFLIVLLRSWQSTRSISGTETETLLDQKVAALLGALGQSSRLLPPAASINEDVYF
jgi:hypothetical protein